MLGGAATHFALAASFFDQVHVVGRVGDGFGDEDLDVVAITGHEHRRRQAHPRTARRSSGPANTAGISTRAKRSTLSSTFLKISSPSCPGSSRDCDVLFLANIQPPAPARACSSSAARVQFVAMDSMNLWIDITRDALVEVIRPRRLRDAERRRATSVDGASRASSRRRATSSRWDPRWSCPSRANTAPR